MKTENVIITAPKTMSLPSTGIISSFFAWAESKEPLRLFYMAAMIMIHANVVIPLVLWSMFAAEAHDIQYLILTVLSFMILVSNLAVMPTKVTISVFALSTIILTVQGIYNLMVILG